MKILCSKRKLFRKYNVIFELDGSFIIYLKLYKLSETIYKPEV